MSVPHLQGTPCGSPLWAMEMFSLLLLDCQIQQIHRPIGVIWGFIFSILYILES